MKIKVTFGRVDDLSKTASRKSYTYYAPDDSVAVGDLVSVPGTWLFNEPQEATVVAIGSDWHGDVSSIIGVIERGEST